MRPRLSLCLWLGPAVLALAQTPVPNQTIQRIELMLERFDAGAWHVIDPALILNQGDRVRFRFRATFDGYLYVMNRSTSGKYEQLFPNEKTGSDNRVVAAKDYQVPATSTAFRIAGPAGHEIVYWMVTPGRLTLSNPPPLPPAGAPAQVTMTPRCDDTVLRARGDCVNSSAGPRLVSRSTDLPPNLTDASPGGGDLMVLRQQETAVISSAAPLTRPVVYEFHLAHR